MGTARPALQRACAWCAPVGLVLTFSGMLVAGWLPPPFPGDGATEVAAYYREHREAIRLGSILIAVGGVLLLPLVAVTSVYLSAIERDRGALSNLQLISGALGPVAFVIPSFLWAGAAFDPARSPEITKLLHDTAWLLFIAGVWTFVVQNLAIGAAVLCDARTDPIFPRWLGYLAIWTAVLFTPSCLVVFFREGPFSWNGIFTFWLAAAAFVAWTAALVWTVQRAITRSVAYGPGASA
ncbi:hypothetical protein [Paraconexibacter sp.]|uniref:hypothetical protein n=1 Tax=Paraconexibacter sp. TaxID=2949640 RepID=UPI0035683491